MFRRRKASLEYVFLLHGTPAGFENLENVRKKKKTTPAIRFLAYKCHNINPQRCRIKCIRFLKLRRFTCRLLSVIPALTTLHT